jgi:hypothetical protein
MVIHPCDLKAVKAISKMEEAIVAHEVMISHQARSDELKYVPVGRNF